MNSRAKITPQAAPRAGRSARAKPLGDLTSKVLAPVIARRAGMTQDLLAAWPELCGTRHAAITRPDRIAWPRRATDDDPFEPGTLIVACDGAASVLFQHETGEIMARINQFFGFAAISKIRIVQRPVAKLASGKKNLRPAPLDEASQKRLDEVVSAVEDDRLKASLEKLGRGVLAKAAARKTG